MPDIYLDVDASLAEVPVNLMPLIDDGDFKTVEDSIAYNASGMDLRWNFVTPAGAFTSTAVTPTTGGDYDWSHQGDGIYTIEIPASGGASINNNTEGYGWFSGKITGVLPFRGPVIGFRAAGLNDLLIESAYSTTRGLAGTALPNAAADAAGGLPISDAGGFDVDNRAPAAAAVTNMNTVFNTDFAANYNTTLDAWKVDVVAIGGDAQSSTDLKDFADTGYDPSGHKVQGVVLVDTTTTNSDMRGTDSAALATDLATVAGYLDTEIAAIQAVTDKLDDTLEDDGGTFRFTTNALEQAPSGGSAPSAADIRAEIDSNSTQLAAILADTDELQTNQGDWLTATGFSTHSAADAASAVRTELTTELGRIDVATSTRLAPTTAGRTLDVTATGAAGIDWANIENVSTTVNLSATSISTSQVVASVTGAVGSVTGAVGSVTGAVGSVTGNVGGNVTGSVASVAGNVGGNVTGSVGSLAAQAKADVNAEVDAALVDADLATATNLATLTAYVDTEVAAIKAKTDNLPSDPADASDIVGAFSTVNTTLGTLVGYVDTEVGAIKAKTDQLTFTETNAVDVNVKYYNGTLQSNGDLPQKIDSVQSSVNSLGTPLQAGDYTAPPSASAISTQVNSDLTTAHGAGSYQTATSVTVSDKTGFKLASDGLDSVATTAPTGVASNFREMLVQTWRRFFKKAEKSATEIKTYADNGSTVLTTQTISASGDDESQGAAS